MRVINVVIFGMAFLAAFQTLRLFARDRSSIGVTVLWTLIWTAVGVFGLFPALIDLLMLPSMMRNRMFFVFVISIMVLYALTFHQTVNNFALQLQIKRMGQELALLRYEVECGYLGDQRAKDVDQAK